MCISALAIDLDQKHIYFQQWSVKLSNNVCSYTINLDFIYLLLFISIYFFYLKQQFVKLRVRV